MRIERIDEKTVKCFLSNEELEEYDIDYKDFILRSDKAKEVVQDIIEQAVEELGYKPPRFAFDLQIMIMPEQGMVLTFSEREPADLKDGEQILECLRDMKELLLKSKEKIASLGNNIQAPQNNDIRQDENTQTKAVAVRPEEVIFAFDKIGALLEYVAALPGNLRVHSELYCMGERYYLYLQKGGASYDRYSRACVQAMEFGSLFTAEPDRMLYVREHAECLIAEQAVKKLQAKS